MFVAYVEGESIFSFVLACCSYEHHLMPFPQVGHILHQLRHWPVNSSLFSVTTIFSYRLDQNKTFLEIEKDFSEKK